MDFMRGTSRISHTKRIRNEEIRILTNRFYTTIDTIQTKQLIWYEHVLRKRINCQSEQQNMSQRQNQGRVGLI